MTKSGLRTLLVLTAALFFAFGSSAVAQRNARPTFRIMMLADGESPLFAERQSALKSEILELMKEDAAITFVEPGTKTNWTLEAAEAALKEGLADRRVDMIIVSGPMAGVAVGRIPKLSKPVLIPYAAPELQGLPRNGNRSGRKNLAYIAGLLNFERNIRQLEEIVRFDRMALIVGEEVVQHLDAPERPIQAASQRLGVRTSLVIANGGAETTLAAIPKDTEAIYIGPIFKWSDEEMQRLVDGINAQELPSYAGGGVHWVERGALATMETDEDETRRMRRAALFVQRIQMGEPAASLPVSFDQRPVLVINMATAKAIGTWPRFEVMAEARLINDQSGTRGPLITLEIAMRDALRANLDLMATGLDIDASYEGVKVARGSWLPQAGADGDFLINDPAVSTSFAQAQRQFTWGIGGSQLLYSPQAHAELRFRRDTYWSREHDYMSARLDTMLEAGEAYLDVLRAKNNEGVNRDNLKLTRKNLSLAETRNAIGVAGREEVFRWQTQIAESRSAVIQASALRNQTEINLNRILNRQLEAPFRVPPPEDVRTVAPGSDQRLVKYLQDAWSFKVFREFMAKEAIRNSPEVRSIDSRISARDELVKGERRQLGIPDIAVVGSFTHVPYAGGRGSEAPAPIPNVDIVGRQTFTWSVGATASLTLFDGASNYARIRRQFREIDRLQTDRAVIAQRLEQDVRSALHQAGFSYANIALTRDAAEASARNLELVTDLYQRGAADIIQLVDAQNQALGAALAAANALYDFLIDALRVQRASGAFSLEGSEEERDDFIERLDAFAAVRKRESRAAPPAAEPTRTNPREQN
ncbi:MAG: TolC family protein [Deltaproteobacteria bacterium]|nr:TolC family protein [Deltaproteobacteria bacterium]NND28298.1 TolC family protein [Myxococcales bacterium]MBT8482457.1 TolC family protein [Deltaproteobacteria bacterium]NNK44685.1 TolC family protein [Myxococcales bacterium]NNL25321.1 TolC family protein [Myxococcales bacterium]